jgi:hypothetical protein
MHKYNGHWKGKYYDESIGYWKHIDTMVIEKA